MIAATSIVSELLNDIIPRVIVFVCLQLLNYPYYPSKVVWFDDDDADD